MTPAPHGRTRLLYQAGLALLTTLALLSNGCQIIGGRPEAQSPGTDGPGSTDGVLYQGAIMMDGGDIPAALEIVREGRRGLWGAMQTTSGIEAEGGGSLRGRSFHLELSYGGECPGRMVLDGEWDPDTSSIAGTIEASDCTGAANGTFRFSSG